MAEADRVSSMVTQANHGFTRGDCVLFDGTNWVLATTGATGVGVVGSLASASAFEFVQLGFLDGLDSLVPGAAYYPDSSGQLSTTANGTAVGIAYQVDVLHVVPALAAASGSSAADLSIYATTTQLAAAIAATAAALAALNIPGVDDYIHSIQDDGVISITPGASGVVFLESDGTQVLTE